MRMRKGFTLIELLIVVVIIGILAAIAIPKFTKTREKAYYSAMKSDLRNIMSEEEIYYSNGSYKYTSDKAGLNFSPSTGVNVGAIDVSSTNGWSATSTHNALGTGHGCAVYYGDATAPTIPGGAAVGQPGVVACDQ